VEPSQKEEAAVNPGPHGDNLEKTSVTGEEADETDSSSGNLKPGKRTLRQSSLKIDFSGGSWGSESASAHGVALRKRDLARTQKRGNRKKKDLTGLKWK